MNFESQKVEVWENIDMKGAYLSILLMGDMPDGSVYMASGSAPKNYYFHPDTGETGEFLAGQIEGSVAYNDKLYLGAYTGARILEYDPQKPYVEGVNPKNIGVVTGQDRPFAMDAGDGWVMGGTICKYGGLPGSIFIYDTRTGEFYEENNVVHNQGIMSVAYKDGLLYGSTTIHGGLGSTPTETAAKIFVYDVAQRKKIKEFVPNIPGLNDPVPTDLGALKFGPDGKLWCATGYTIFSVNTDTEEVSDVMTFGKWEKYGTETWKWKPTYIEFDDKGNMYSNMYGLRVINPKTGEHKQLTTYATNDYTIGGDGNLYLVTGSDVRVIPMLNETPSFDYTNYAQQFGGEGMLVLKTGYSVASANGKAKYIDPANKKVVPFVENGRTLVPIRFIAESLGAEVNWDDATQTATLTKGDTIVSISIGSSEMIFVAGQLQGVLEYENKVYLGAYTGARVLVYDPNQPHIENENPNLKGAILPHQDRPFALTAGKDKIYFGTTAVYGRLSGAIATYDIQTEELTTHFAPVENHGIMGLTYRDGLLYCSTTVYGGLGSKPTETNAKLFVYDPEKREVLRIFEPHFQNAPHPLYIGGLGFDEKGRLWGASGLTLFEFDPQSGAVVRELNFGDYDYPPNVHQWRQTYIRFDGEGHLFVNLNGIRAVDIETMEYQTLTDMDTPLYTIAEDGNLYYTYEENSKLYQIKIGE